MATAASIPSPAASDFYCRVGRRSPLRGVTNLYDAGTSTRRTLGWRAPTSTPNTAIVHDLTTLRDRSREAVRNNGYGKGSIDKLVTNIVGTGIKPLSSAKDTAFRKAIQALWLLWTDVSDADGLLDFYGQQAQATRCWLEAGEVFVRLRSRLPSDGLPVPLQVQVLEPEMCPHYFTGTWNGNSIRAGIEFNKIGRRVAYWFYESRPGDDIAAGGFVQNMADLRRVPADRVMHIYDPLRAGQIRGIPHLTQALLKLRELDKLEDAVLLRHQLANLFAAFITKGNNDGGDVNVWTGLAADSSSSERPVVSLEPGILQELGSGEQIQFSDPPDPSATLPAYMKQQLMSISAAEGVPYEVLTGDMAGLNDRVMRVVLHEFRRAIKVRQHHILAYQMCRPTWNAFLDSAFFFNSLGLTIPTEFLDDPTEWAAVKWMPQGWPYIHPVQDVQATKEAIRCGFTSRASAVSEQGEDAEVIDAEQASDNDRADELGLIYDSDGRQSATGPKLSGPADTTDQPPASAEPPEDPAADPADAEDGSGKEQD